MHGEVITRARVTDDRRDASSELVSARSLRAAA